jgi:zinc protease
MAINTYTLQNGMQVVLEENRTAKVVAFNALIKVGSVYETAKESGICHVIEHMLFKGTPSRPNGTIAMEVEAAGGDINAYTSFDQTVFYINMASRFADEGLEILADAIKNPLFDEEELARETEVILEEIRREQDSPARMVGEYLFQNSFKVHNYGRPIIGFPETVKSFTQKTLLDFYRKWYTPANTAFIAVGDFDEKKMLARIEKTFSDFSGGKKPEANLKSEPAQNSPRLILKEMNVQSAYFALGLHIPAITHPDVPTLDIMAHILGGTDSSRLEQQVKEKKRLAHNIYSIAYTPRYPGLLYITGMCSDRELLCTIEAVREETVKMMTSPVTAAELSRAKINLRSTEIYEKETVGGQSSKIASYMAIADSHEFEKRYFQMMSDVTSEDVRNIAQKYLSLSKATFVAVVPEKSKWPSQKNVLRNALCLEGRKKFAKAASFASKPQVIKLQNGAKLIVRENHKLPTLAICAATLSGTRMETRRNNGISTLLAKTMVKGTKTRNALAIARDIEKIAGHVGGFSGRNTSGVKSEFLSEHLHDGLSLFCDVLCNPAFENFEVKNEKEIILKAIKDQEDNLSSLAFAKFLEKLFPKHPYGLAALGTAKTVKALGSDDLIRHHSRTMRSGDMVITVSGDVNPDEARNLIEEMLSCMRPGKKNLPNLRPDKKPDSPKEASLTKKNKQQTHIVLGFQGTTYKNEDRFAMAVLNNILSGQGGRLFRELRDKMSLAYAVNSVHQEGIEPGFFAIYLGTDPSKEQIAIDAIKRELNAIRTNLISPEELDRSKSYLAGTYELELQRNDSLANMYAFYELYGLGLDEVDLHPKKIMKVSRNDVFETAQKYIDLNAYTMAIVRPA